MTSSPHWDTSHLSNAICETSAALKERRLDAALELLAAIASGRGDAVAGETVGALRDDYHRLLDYMAGGYVDERRGELYRDFLRRAYRLYEQMRRDIELATEERRTGYASTRHTNEHLHIPQTVGALFATTAPVSDRVLFDVVWTSAHWRDEELAAARQYYEKVDAARRCVLLSATMLAALHFFDSVKLRFLLGAFREEQPTLQVRAVVGAVAVMLHHPTKVALCPELREEWATLWDENGEQLSLLLTELQAQLLLTSVTHRVENKVQQDILPDMMRQARSQGRKGWGAALTEQMERPELPEELSEKLSSLMALQRKGADVFIGSFKMLKQRFPFFSVAANWFLPFNRQHPDLRTVKASALLTALEKSTQLCDSDKYSLALLMQGLDTPETPEATPERLSEMMLSADQAQAADGGACVSGLSAAHSSALRAYIQDIYRYFTLYRGRDETVDPFVEMPLLMTVPLLDTLPGLWQQPARLTALADFAFGVECYPAAGAFYRLLPPAPDVLYKVGYCHQVEHDYAAAATAYEQAHLLADPTEWSLRRLAECRRRLGDDAAAAALYAQLEQRAPAAADIPLYMGECYISLQQYEAALSALYKAYYLSPEEGRLWRALAWCHLWLQQGDKAADFYTRILAANPTPDDYLNAGHAAWVTGDVREAVTRYASFLKQRDLSCSAETLFAADTDLLQTYGLHDDDLQMMSDVVGRFSAQG
jgi:hypothetical protein